MSEELEKIRNIVKDQLRYVLNPISDRDLGSVDNKSAHMVIQTYTMLQILEMLDNINYKLAMTNTNIEDVEQEIAKMNRGYQ